MQTKPKILRRALIAKTDIFQVESLDLVFSNGVQRRFERIPGGRLSVLIVPLLNEDTLLLIREYAAGTERYELGFPKGLVDPGEHPTQAADRELQEEIGYGAHRLEPLKILSLAPGYIGHRTQVVLARDLYPKTASGDEPEPIGVVPWPLSEMDRLLERDDFSEARAIAALLLLQKRGISP